MTKTQQIQKAVQQLPSWEIEDFLANSWFEGWQDMSLNQQKCIMADDAINNWPQELIEKLLKK
jgi:hypothetical protein